MKKTMSKLMAYALVAILFSCSRPAYTGFFGKSSPSVGYSNIQTAVPENLEATEAAVPVLSVPTYAESAQLEVDNHSLTKKKGKYAVVANKTNLENVSIQNEVNQVKTTVSKPIQVLGGDAGAKSQTVAFIMAILSWAFLSSLIPIHRFYLGGKKNVTAGILMIVFGVLTFGIVSVIWGLIDWIRILTNSLKPGKGEYDTLMGK